MYSGLLVMNYSGSRNAMDCKTTERFQMSFSHERFCTHPRSTKKVALFFRRMLNWFLIFKDFMPNAFYTLNKDSIRKVTLISDVSHNLSLFWFFFFCKIELKYVTIASLKYVYVKRGQVFFNFTDL